ncbi:MAG: hypothetical protein K8H84_12165, partial [Sulfuricella denitrificans]|nr:hypothetical protein [Sulfuricella denitrificans]
SSPGRPCVLLVRVALGGSRTGVHWTTSGTVKLRMPPRQSRGNSLGISLSLAVVALGVFGNKESVDLLLNFVNKPRNDVLSGVEQMAFIQAANSIGTLTRHKYDKAIAFTHNCIERPNGILDTLQWIPINHPVRNYFRYQCMAGLGRSGTISAFNYLAARIKYIESQNPRRKTKEYSALEKAMAVNLEARRVGVERYLVEGIDPEAHYDVVTSDKYPAEPRCFFFLYNKNGANKTIAKKIENGDIDDAVIFASGIAANGIGGKFFLSHLLSYFDEIKLTSVNDVKRLKLLALMIGLTSRPPNVDNNIDHVERSRLLDLLIRSSKVSYWVDHDRILSADESLVSEIARKAVESVANGIAVNGSEKAERTLRQSELTSRELPLLEEVKGEDVIEVCRRIQKELEYE